jgi:hypothetical protein
VTTNQDKSSRLILVSDSNRPNQKILKIAKMFIGKIIANATLRVKKSGREGKDKWFTIAKSPNGI